MFVFVDAEEISCIYCVSERVWKGLAELEKSEYLWAVVETGRLFPNGDRGMEANYPTDPSDEQWQAVSRLIPPAKPGGRPREVNMRQVLNGLFYIARTGCAWRMLPKD